MRSGLIIYDSAFGNTAKVGYAIAGALRPTCRIVIKHVKNAKPADIKEADLVIVGSPTQGGHPTADIQDYLGKLNKTALKGKQVAAFDTRFALQDHGKALFILMRTIGFAATKIAGALTAKGGNLITLPEGFIVDDKKGPLRKGELQRAAEWAQASLA